MRGLIQRVNGAAVSVDGNVVGEIGRGLLLFLGIENGDNRERADRMLQKVINYRVFPDDEGRMNLSVRDIGGGLLVISQFTLAADTGRGLRPSFTPAAAPELAEPLYEYWVSRAREMHDPVATGIFGAAMEVSLRNDGPVTFLLET